MAGEATRDEDRADVAIEVDDGIGCRNAGVNRVVGDAILVGDECSDRQGRRRQGKKDAGGDRTVTHHGDGTERFGHDSIIFVLSIRPSLNSQVDRGDAQVFGEDGRRLMSRGAWLAKIPASMRPQPSIVRSS